MKASFDRELAQLRVLYQQNLSAYSEQLQQAWRLLKTKLDDDLVAEISGLAHRLAGSGKAYGFGNCLRSREILSVPVRRLL